MVLTKKKKGLALLKEENEKGKRTNNSQDQPRKTKIGGKEKNYEIESFIAFQKICLQVQKL